MPLNREHEVAELNKAGQHVTRAEVLISEQILRIETLRIRGVGTDDAERFLRELEGQLAAMRTHRQIIIDTIAQIDAKLT